MNLRLTASLLLLFAAACAGRDEGGGGTLSRMDASSAGDAAEGDAGAAGGDAGGADGGRADAGSGDAALGEPITANPLEWTWVDVPEARCMNDSPTGFGVNINPASTKLLIFLTGGNACFNALSCAVTANPNGYGMTQFMREQNMLSSGAFDRTAQENYLKDWSYVYVPYCSGDVFAGSRPAADVEGQTYKFVGWNNLGHFLARIVPTFPNVTEVLFTGVSAGGFGAAVNYDRAQRSFGPGVRVTLLDDSGPPMGSSFLAPCLQRHFRTLWDFDSGPLALCQGCADTTDGSFTEGYLSYLTATYPDRNFALISSDADATIRGFWGFGEDNCRYLTGVIGIPSYDATKFRMGLIDLRDNLTGPSSRFRLYMPTSTRHVWISSAPWTVEENGVVLQDWLRQAIEDDPAWGNVP